MRLPRAVLAQRDRTPSVIDPCAHKRILDAPGCVEPQRRKQENANACDRQSGSQRLAGRGGHGHVHTAIETWAASLKNRSKVHASLARPAATAAVGLMVLFFRH